MQDSLDLLAQRFHELQCDNLVTERLLKEACKSNKALRKELKRCNRKLFKRRREVRRLRARFEEAINYARQCYDLKIRFDG